MPCVYLVLQMPFVLAVLDDITLGPYSIMDAEHLHPHIAGALVACWSVGLLVPVKQVPMGEQCRSSQGRWLAIRPSLLSVCTYAQQSPQVYQCICAHQWLV